MRSERQVLFWLAVLLAAVTAVLMLRQVLLPFVVGMVLAYALNPIAERLVRLGLPRGVASGIVVAALVVVLILLVVLLVPILVSQTRQLIAALPGEIQRLAGLLDGIGREHLGDRFGSAKESFERAMTDLAANWPTIAQYVAGLAWNQGQALISFVSVLLITPLVVFYLMVDWHPMLKKIDGWLPREHEPTIRRLAGEMNEAIAAFIRGQGFVCIVLGTIYALGLSWIGVNYGLLIGLATGLASFVPFIGWALGLMAAAILALVQFWPDPTPVLLVVGLFALGQALDAAVLSPRIVGPKIGLHPVWLLFALIVFSYLFGFVGLLVAVPLAAAVGVLVRFALQVYLDSAIYRGGPEPVESGPAERRLP